MNLNKKLCRKFQIGGFCLLSSFQVCAQAQPDTTKPAIALPEVSITGVRAISGMGWLGDTQDGAVFVGKKTHVLLLDSLVANTAQNNPRQVMGRIPGANFSETEGAGYPSNGIGFRGLDPSQSSETNVRQNGYNITADLYGYPEAYYLPPLEAVERIEVIRGAASLQFGPQFGGVINYRMRSGPTDQTAQVQAAQTVGSYGLSSSYISVGGQVGKVNYFAYGQYKTAQGWRPNSDFRTFSGFGKLSWQATSRLRLGLEYTLTRNRIHMQGGLSDLQYAKDPTQSFRARNWLTSPWNVLAATADYQLGAHTSVSVKSAFNTSARNLVWRNEDGGPAAPDSISTETGTYVNREVSKQSFTNSTTEIRLLHDYKAGGRQQTLAVGVRGFYGEMSRNGGGTGTTESGYDFSLVDPHYAYSLSFSTTNLAVFAEHAIRLSNRFSVTPGIRYEFLRSTQQGYTAAEGGQDLASNLAKNRKVLLAGIGAGFDLGAGIQMHGNISQAYRPLDYSSLTPVGTIASVDPNLKDSKGYNADIGVRGQYKGWLHFDVGLFALQYNNRVGLIERTDANGNTSPFRTNVANSLHKGLESYVEVHPLRALSTSKKAGLDISVFNSLGLIDARYTSGEFKGKYVEYAPPMINRTGLTVSAWKIGLTYQLSYVAKSYGDAGNASTPSADAVAGPIPAYVVMDLSGQFTLKRFVLKAGCNNLANKAYFTKRADEYPGPGIIPSQARSWYLGLSARF